MNNRNKNQAFINIFLIIILIAFSTFTYIYQLNLKNDKNIYTVSSASLNANGTEYQNVDILTQKFKRITEGQHLIVFIKLPDINVTNPVITYPAYNTVVNVYYEGKIIYSYGWEDYYNNTEIGNGNYIIPLKDNFQNKEITFDFMATDKTGFVLAPTIKIMNEGYFYKNLIKSNLLFIIISVFEIALAITLFIIALMNRKRYKNSNSLIWIGCLFFLTALYSLSVSRVLQIITSNLKVITYIEYYSFYMLIIPILLIEYNFFNTKREKNICKLLLIIQSTFVITVMILDFLKIIDCSAPLVYSHILLASECITLIILLLINKNTLTPGNKIMLYGFFSIIAITLFELLRYNLNEHIFHAKILVSSSLPITTTVFLAIMFYSLGSSLIKTINEKIDLAALEKIAYKDMLTNINNRNFCENYFRQNIEDNLKDEYTIINFDLNNLKVVNDTIGHSAGDEMLKSFAKYLAEVYSPVGVIARMGGDEFIAILKNTAPEKVTKLSINLQNKIDEFNLVSPQGFPLSVAFGVAIRKKNDPKSIWKVYEESDKAMYENKQKSRK